MHNSMNKLIPLIVTIFIVLAEVAISFNSALLPNIQSDFDSSTQITQMTVGLGLFALGLAGVIYGGLSDIVGRRPVYLFAISIFSVTSLMCYFAPSIEMLLLARFLQGVGSGAGWVVGNACLKDLYDGKDYTRIMNNIHAVAGITPAIAPMIGSYLAVLIGWRNCFLILFILSAFGVYAIYRYQAETIKEKEKFIFTNFTQKYKDVLVDRKFLRYCFLKVMMVMLLFCEVGNVPLIFINHLDVDPKYYGLYIFPLFIFYILATMSTSKLLKKYSIDNILNMGMYFIIISNILILSLSYFVEPTAIQIQCCKIFTFIGWGMIFGNATAEIVSAVNGRAGAASALMISLEMLFSSIGIYILSFFFNGTILPLAIFMLFVTIWVLFLFNINRLK